MKTLILVLAVGISALATAGTVIANNDVTLAGGEVKDVFTGEKVSAGGVKLVLVDNKGAISEFCSKALGMDDGKYTSLWAKKSFRDGLPTPKSKTSDAEVTDFVKSTSGAVGYVSGAAGAGVKEISKY